MADTSTSNGSLYSTHWYRMGALSPRLQPGTHIQRQVLRGEQWFVFTHPISGQHYRLNQTAYELIGRLDGEHTLDVLWTGLQRIVGDDAPTQDEVIAMLVQLLEIGLILFDRLPDLPVLAQRQKLQRRRERTDNLNPLAFRLRLFNPDPLLKKLSVWGFVLLHPVAIWLWCGLTGWALLHTILSWDEIHAYASAHLLTPRCLFLAWLAYPVMKCLHELGHGIAVHYWGGTVKEAGVGFFFADACPVCRCFGCDGVRHEVATGRCEFRGHCGGIGTGCGGFGSLEHHRNRRGTRYGSCCHGDWRPVDHPVQRQSIVALRWILHFVRHP
ncbi:MAG: PqqD family protein [Burkholderiaceae bacterium]